MKGMEGDGREDTHSLQSQLGETCRTWFPFLESILSIPHFRSPQIPLIAVNLFFGRLEKVVVSFRSDDDSYPLLDS